MNVHHHNMAGRRTCAVPPGIETKEADELAEMKAALGGYTKVTTDGFKQFRDDMATITDRMKSVEQKLARPTGDGLPAEAKTLGAQVVAADQVKSLVANGGRGTARVEVIERKAITSASSSAGGMVAPDRRGEIINLPRRQLRVRNLIAPGQTASNTVHFMKEKVVTNNAAVVAEGGTKPESNITYEPKESPVRTIAHVMTVSRQIMDDVPMLQSILDTSMRYMLADVEEYELLLGDGTGEHLTGLITAATAYDTTENVAGDNYADTIQRAITQAQEASQLPMTGIVLNNVDWASMVGMKDADGRYLSGGPFSDTAPRLWGLPVVETPIMPLGSFLVMNGLQAAQIFDRMETEVLISSEHADYFAKNQLLIRCENRLAMVIKRPQALVYGSYPAP
jgi:HK97 family phage major capsid protein